MIIWNPDTCFCILDDTNKKILKPCRIHLNKRFSDTKAHNASFNRTEADSRDSEKKRIEKESTRR